MFLGTREGRVLVKWIQMYRFLIPKSQVRTA